ncbi:hypothetical protein DsansV1_C27g0197241 [Dioscorea sansibarensis]
MMTNLLFFVDEEFVVVFICVDLICVSVAAFLVCVCFFSKKRLLFRISVLLGFVSVFKLFLISVFSRKTKKIFYLFFIGVLSCTLPIAGFLERFDFLRGSRSDLFL